MKQDFEILVPEVRLELTRFYPVDFESTASTIPPPGEGAYASLCIRIGIMPQDFPFDKSFVKRPL